MRWTEATEQICSHQLPLNTFHSETFTFMTYGWILLKQGHLESCWERETGREEESLGGRTVLASLPVSPQPSPHDGEALELDTGRLSIRVLGLPPGPLSHWCPESFERTSENV